MEGLDWGSGMDTERTRDEEDGIQQSPVSPPGFSSWPLGDYL